MFVWVIPLVLKQALLASQPAHFTILDLAGTIVWLVGM
jgi:hypothetical protein